MRRPSAAKETLSSLLSPSSSLQLTTSSSSSLPPLPPIVGVASVATGASSSSSSSGIGSRSSHNKVLSPVEGGGDDGDGSSSSANQMSEFSYFTPTKRRKRVLRVTTSFTTPTPTKTPRNISTKSSSSISSGHSRRAYNNNMLFNKNMNATCWSTIGVALLWMAVICLYVHEDYDEEGHRKIPHSVSMTQHNHQRQLLRHRRHQDHHHHHYGLTSYYDQQYDLHPVPNSLGSDADKEEEDEEEDHDDLTDPSNWNHRHQDHHQLLHQELEQHFPYIRALQQAFDDLPSSQGRISPRKRLTEDKHYEMDRLWCTFFHHQLHHEQDTSSCSLTACNNHNHNNHLDSDADAAAAGGYWIDHGGSTPTTSGLSEFAPQHQQGRGQGHPHHVREQQQGKKISQRQIPQTSAANGCVVSHKYQFVYIHVLKSGGMTIKSFLKNALCEGSTHMPCRTNINNKSGDASTDVLQVADCDVVFRDPRVAQDYLVWTVVRNPFARLYSNYAMALAFAKKEKVHENNDDGNEHEHRHDKEQDDQEDMEKALSFSFTEYVVHPELRPLYSWTDPVHYQPQYQFLFSSNGCPVVDYVLRMETLQEDFERLLQLINSEELNSYYREHGLVHASDTDYGRRRILDQQQTLQQVYSHSAAATNIATATTNAAAAAAATHSALRDHVALEYARDFEIFRYDKLQVPSTR